MFISCSTKESFWGADISGGDAPGGHIRRRHQWHPVSARAYLNVPADVCGSAAKVLPDSGPLPALRSLKAKQGHPSSVIRHPSSVLCYPSSALCYLL